MRTSLILLLLNCAISFAESAVESGPAFAIRDDTASAAVVATDDDFTFAGAYSFQGTEAQWSPDGQMVSIHVPRMYRSGGSAYAVLRWNGKGFAEIALPEDAIPIRWAANNRLVCSVRTEATLQLNADKKAFTGTRAKATNSK